MDVLKLGTRRSLLAWAQSSWVARELERLHPGLQVQLVGIETRGDRILDVPLSKVEGKEFFVAELDQALRSGEVDLNVHSLKDLSLERPAEFRLGCIPRRENPRDVILFGPNILTKLKSGKPIRIGSSSPRRLENIPAFLTKALPRFLPETGPEAEVELDPFNLDELPAPTVQFVEIRGNVNTRLSRVHEPEGSSKQLDGVVLAFAGLIRLWRDQSGQAELRKLLKGVRWMVLPLKQCPSAPGQGALAVECRANDERVIRILSALHHPSSAARVEREREILKKWGGGCHQRFGAVCVASAELGDLLFIRGVQPDGTFVDEMQRERPRPPEQAPLGVWDGSFWRGSGLEWAYGEKEAEALSSHQCVFVAHSRAIPGEWAEQFQAHRVWTSGTASWFRLAKLGIWVEGCTEGLGVEDFLSTAAEPVLGLDRLSDWAVLTHVNGAGSWNFGEPVPTYRVVQDREEPARAALRNATHVFWSSGSQFERFREWVPSGAQHACGPGKTAKVLRDHGIRPLVFLSSEEWRKWLAS